MFDQQDLTDLIDVLYEYNSVPSITEICSELSFTKEKVEEMLELLFNYGIIDMDGYQMELLVSYDYAIIIAETLVND